jgi:ATP-dependent DNA helicase RecG
MVIEHADASDSHNSINCAAASAAVRRQHVLSALFEEPLTDTAKARLKVIYETNDGFEIARQDLLIRGPGEFLGARQSGAPLLRFADLDRDIALIEQARDDADDLMLREPAAATAHLARWLGGKQEFFKA